MKPLQGARDSYVEARNKILLESNGLNAAAVVRARAPARLWMHLYLSRGNGGEDSLDHGRGEMRERREREWNRLRFGGLLRSIIDKCLVECSRWSDC